MIEVASLTKTFKTKAVLNSLDLRVTKGEKLALIGHNGSGKTTLIRCLLGLHVYSGSIRINGKDPATSRVETLADIGFVPQSPPALRMTVAEFVRLLCALCHLSQEDVRALSAGLNLELSAIWKMPFRSLSGGMKQKLLIAAALARRPAILILDEPTANLDPAARGAFFDALGQLSPETVLLISSHRVDELAGLVTRLIELDGGHIARDETVRVSGDASGKRLRCRLSLQDPTASIVDGLREWGLTAETGGEWQGSINSLDRFRFIADLARWSGALREVNLCDFDVRDEGQS